MHKLTVILHELIGMAGFGPNQTGALHGLADEVAAEIEQHVEQKFADATTVKPAELAPVTPAPDGTAGA